PPTIQTIQISTGGPYDNGSLNLSTTATVGLLGSTEPLRTIRLYLHDRDYLGNTGSGISNVRYYLRFNGASGNYQFTPLTLSSWTYADPPTITWVQARSTTTVPFAVAIASSVPWFDSQDYYICFEVTDSAGNKTQDPCYPWSFKYDSAPPTISNVSIASMTTYSDSSDLPNAISGAVVDELNQVGKSPVGVKRVGVGVWRQSDGKWFQIMSPNWSTERADPFITSFSGNNWSLDPLGSSAGSFWDSRSTDTYYLYVWAQDNVAYKFPNEDWYQNRTSTVGAAALKAVFHWEVQAPSSTLISPTTASNMVWYSTNPGYNLPAIKAYVFDQPATGPGAGDDTNCTMTGAPGPLAGRARNVCAEEIEVQQTSNGGCWNGTDFFGVCDTPPVFRTMSTVANSTYSFDTQSVPTIQTNGFWDKLVPGVAYRIRVRGKDNGVTSGNVWKPNTEAPPNVADCAALSYGEYNVRCFRVDKAAPASIVTYPANGSDASAPISVTGNTSDPHSGLGKVFIAVCRDQGGGSGVPNTSACLAATDAAAQFDQPLHYFEASVSAWTLDLTNVVNWTNGEYYHVLVRSTDMVNNQEGTVVAPANSSNHVMFRIVSAEASGRIKTPSSINATYPFYKPTNLMSISGTASGKTHIQVNIKDTDANLYYDNVSPYWTGTSAWVPNPTPQAVAGDTTWTYVFPGPWRVNHNYTISLRACDVGLISCSGILDTEFRDRFHGPGAQHHRAQRRGPQDRRTGCFDRAHHRRLGSRAEREHESQRGLLPDHPAQGLA
ncbi:MAG: hypothetical protein WC881_11025, partial [Elusimicrobiota bacterium]